MDEVKLARQAMQRHIDELADLTRQTSKIADSMRLIDSNVASFADFTRLQPMHHKQTEYKF